MHAVIVALYTLAATADLTLLLRRKRRMTTVKRSRRLNRALTFGVKRLSPVPEPIPFQARPICSSSPSSMATCSSSSAANSAQRSRSKPGDNEAANFMKWSRVRRSISSAA